MQGLEERGLSQSLRVHCRCKRAQKMLTRSIALRHKLQLQQCHLGCTLLGVETNAES